MLLYKWCWHLKKETGSPNSLDVAAYAILANLCAPPSNEEVQEPWFSPQLHPESPGEL